MKLKAKITSTILSMALALGVMGFAVFAAATQTLTVTNTVNFVSDHVLATVEGVVTDAYAGTFVDYGPETTDTGSSTTQLPPWEIGNNMQFALETTPIKITLTIENLSAERFFTFELSQIAHESFNGEPLGSTNINRSVTYSTTAGGIVVSGTYYDDGAIRVDAEATATIVITLKIADTGLSVNEFNNNFTVTLTNEGTEAPGSIFVFSPALKSISIPQGETLTYENLPEMTVENGPAFYGFFKTLNEGVYEEKITLPYTAEESGEALFTKMGEIPANLTFTLINNNTEYSVSKNANTIGDIEIPAFINEIPVTTIPNSCFRNSSSITSIIIGDKVKTVGNQPFENCTSLTSVTIGGSVTSIGARAFLSCTSLTEINFNAINMNNLSGNLLESLFTAVGTNTSGTTVNIGVNVTKIPDYLFYVGTDNNPKITTVNFPDNGSCLNIGKWSFRYCKYLTSIDIPDSVTTIGEYAFSNCTGLSSATIGDNVTSIDKSAFRSCILLASITIPENVVSIGDGAFYGYTSLTEINFNATNMNNLLSSDYVFRLAGDNTTGTTVNIGANVTKIPDHLFYSGGNIQTVVFLGNSCLSIGQFAFRECQSLTSINIPDSVTSIGDYAFAFCTVLTEIEIPSSVIFIGQNAFKSTKLTEIEFESVTTIGYEAFSGCSNLASITVSDSLITVGFGAFTNTSWYTNQSDGTVYVGKVAYTFKGTMSSDTSIVLAEGTKAITHSAFRDKSLISIKIPSSVTSIDFNAFANCTLLNTVIIDSDTVVNALTGNDVLGHLIYNIASGGKIYLLEGLSATTYVTNNYTLTTTDKSGYNMYVKNA